MRFAKNQEGLKMGLRNKGNMGNRKTENVAKELRRYIRLGGSRIVWGYK